MRTAFLTAVGVASLAALTVWPAAEAAAQSRPGERLRRDCREQVADRREDVRDRREDVRDRRHQGGLPDRLENVRDRREDRRDRREDRRDRRQGPLGCS